MADVINNDYEKILNSFTSIFEFSRYDRLSYDLENKKIADIASDEHLINNDYYRNYGAYRHDIKAEEYIVKENETYLDDNELNDNYYDYDHFSNFKDPDNEDKTYDAMQFAGCVLNPAFATNANEASLEDIFVEYGYNYLKAKNDSYIADENNKELYYFDKDLGINSYEIKPVGYEYINYDKEKKDENAEDRYEKVEYDGTYVPTVEELLSGNLYIVISSGNLDYCRKIYFNNNYMPTLFINDDKLKAKQDLYVINELQPMKLCDITLYKKLGCLIKWKYLFNITLTDTFKKNIQTLIYNLYKDINNIQSVESVNLAEYADKVYLTPFYKVYLKVTLGKDVDTLSNSINDKQIVYSNTAVQYNSKSGDNTVNKEIDVVTGGGYDDFNYNNIKIFTDDNDKNKATSEIIDYSNITNIQTENIDSKYIENILNPKIELYIKASYAIAVQGFKNKPEDTPKYSLYWYKIVEDKS